MYTPYCVECKKEFKHSGSLATHRYKFHRTSSQKGDEEISFNHKPHSRNPSRTQNEVKYDSDNSRTKNSGSLATRRYKLHGSSRQKGEGDVIAVNDRANTTNPSRTQNEVKYDSDNSGAVGTYTGSTSKDKSGEYEDDSKTEIELLKNRRTLRNIRNKISLYRKMEALENDDKAGLEPIEEAIFNETIMTEISKIEKLASKHKFDEIINDHIETLQKMFMALSYGVIPVTKPQRSEITDFQRKLIEAIEKSDEYDAGDLIRENTRDLTNLFRIIEDSLKLAIKSFHKFPLNKDAQQMSSESEESDSTMDDY